MKDLRRIVQFWEARPAQPLAMATLVAAHGSSYRRPGARMMISSCGESIGGVSAGCIEEEVIECARKVLRTDTPRLMTFDTRLRFGCHGTIEVFVEPVTGEVMSALADCAARRRNCRLETVLEGSAQGTRIGEFEEAPGSFLQTIEPVLQLILIGESPDAVALRNHGTLLEWEVLQLDSAPVPAAMLDERTAVVIATHNFGRDYAALCDLLPAGLRYLGVVGSRRRREDLLFDLMYNGVECRSGLFAPAGLHLGADSPDEIALSILAEIQSVFGGGTGQQLRHRKAPIHQHFSGTVPCAESPA
ncbi:MAG TPA: XdhC family protein [Verrucomicrobiales bacterium]|nr:XdhC family protein [Verrucomicrobiales bacterium]